MFRSQHELALLPIPGGWVWKTEEIAGRRCQLLLPADGEAFLADEAHADHWPDPYWTQIWPAARSLASIILKQSWRRGTKVLELGCGNGFVGLAALARGCEVTFSDYVPLAVELAVANASANDFGAARGQVLDWREPPADLRYEVILAADVLYDPELHAPLFHTIEATLAPSGYLWLGDPGREIAGQFVHQARSEGWQVTLHTAEFAPASSSIRGEFRLIELRRGSYSR